MPDDTQPRADSDSAPVGGPGGTSRGERPPLELLPFRAVRFARTGAELAAVTAPPYDVISPAQREQLASEPANVVRLTLPTEGYDAAAAQLRAWLADGTLVQDERPGLYAYEITAADGHVQRGLVGLVGVRPAEDGVVLPHESTMGGPVQDRLELLRATQAHLEPIFLVYDGAGAASAVLDTATGGEPLIDCAIGDERHRVWSITGSEDLDAVAGDLAPRSALIADGHHRYATYLADRADRPGGPAEHGLALLVDARQHGPQVHPIHRVLLGLGLDAVVSAAEAGFTVSWLAAGDPTSWLRELAGSGPRFVVTDGERAALLSEPDAARLDAALPPDRSPAWRGLDVVVAHHFLVRDLLTTDDGEEQVGFAHDADEAVEAARRHGGTALLLNPTPVEAVAEVGAAGERMPRKSTLFTPKPRTGLLIRLLEEPS